jgi:putative ubiquitin-RnfH superfamily antitoxin RatB of RatAB toxin-antitoxin module
MIHVLVVFSPGPRQVIETKLSVPEGTTLAQALTLIDPAALQDAGRQHPGDAGRVAGIWGRKVDAQTLLREGDRVELYRPLRVDPKVARRERFVGQGARSAGLFAQRRANSKAGY